MFHPIMTKLEIDVSQESELAEAIELAHVCRMPAVIVHQDLAVTASMYRVRQQASCAIIVPVDWPKGENRGMQKLRFMPVAALSQDGFEILLSPSDDPGEIQREMMTLSSFVQDQLPEVVKIRYVLGAFSRDEQYVVNVCKAMSKIPAPDMIRLDHNTRLQQTKANIQAHNKLINLVRSHTRRPIKISGNITSTNVITSCEADRYAVSLRQAQAIVRELRSCGGKLAKPVKAESDVSSGQQ